MSPAPLRKTSGVRLANALPFLTVFAALAVAFAGYSLLILPMIGPLLSGGKLDVSAIRQTVDSEQADSSAVVDALKQFKTAINPSLREKIDQAVPADKDIPGLFVQMDALAALHNMVLLSIDMIADEKTVTPQGDKQVNIAMNVGGADYKSFKLYLQDVERSLRIFDVQSIIFSAPHVGEKAGAAGQTPTNANTYSLTVKAYYMGN